MNDDNPSEIEDGINNEVLEPTAEDETSREPPDPKFLQFLMEHSVPIASVLFIGLVICLLLHIAASTNALDRSGVKDVADILNNSIQAVAIVIGGGWALFTFRRGRQFQESLIPSISGQIAIIDDQTFIVVNTHIKNVGRSKIEFAPGASTLEVYEYIKTPVSEVITMPDKMLRQFHPLHADDLYIEPSEIIYGTRLIAIPNSPDIGFRLEFRVISAKQFKWRTSCMVEKSGATANINRSERP